MPDDIWQTRVQRGLALLDSSQPDQARTLCMLNKILDTSTRDDFLNDYFNIQQTAGGLPDSFPFDQFREQVSAHLRQVLNIQPTMTDNDGNTTAMPEPDDDGLRMQLLAPDHTLVQIFGFLNGTVHQAAPGVVHIGLWNYVLDSTKDDRSIYSCYRDIFVDNR
jgi:hypothetical protein